MKTSHKILLMVLLAVWWIVSTYWSVRSMSSLRHMREDIAAIRQSGLELGGKAERFLNERNQCRAKVKECEDAKMEMFRMYEECEQEFGDYKRANE